MDNSSERERDSRNAEDRQGGRLEITYGLVGKVLVAEVHYPKSVTRKSPAMGGGLTERSSGVGHGRCGQNPRTCHKNQPLSNV